MKAERNISRAWAFLLGWLSAVSALGCLVTGLRLTGYGLLPMILGCMICAIFFSLTMPWKGWYLAPGIPLLLGILFLEPLLLSIESLLMQISAQYNLGYGWGILRWSDVDLQDVSLMPALWLVGCCIAFFVSYGILRSRRAWGGCIAAAIPLCACLVLTDTVPDTVYLFLLFLCLLLQILPAHIRRRDMRQGNRLIGILALPLAVVLGALFWLVPQEGYHQQHLAQTLEDWVVSWFSEESVTPLTPSHSIAGPVNTSTIQLSSTGPLHGQQTPVMTVTAQQSGNMYLRGSVYDVYDGLTWTQDPQTAETDWDFWCDGKSKTVTIATLQPHSILYTPYAPYQLGNRIQMENTADLTRYTVSYNTPPTYNEAWEQSAEGLPDKYLALPEATRQAALEILESISLPQGVWAAASAIRDYVNQSAVYDLNTPAMPSNQPDFALWFLQESDRGYCVHFATSTVILLRSAGIPARYVTGYLFNAVEGEPVTVRRGNSHAWVECYVTGTGWVVVEPTPGNGLQPTTDPTQETQTATVPQTFPSEITEDTHEIPVQQTQSVPSVTTPSIAKPQKPNGASFNWTPFLLILMGMGFIPAQWRLRFYLRERMQHSGSTNAQALRRWREIALHAKLRKEQPMEMLSLARKAKYSQYQITDKELQEMDRWLIRSRRQFRRDCLWKQLLYTLIFAIY